MNRMSLALSMLVLTVAPVVAAEDVANGESQFRKCKACHDIGEAGKNKVGPKLVNIIGAKAGAVADYSYSDDLKKLATNGFTWSEENMSKYIENPKSVAPTGKMAFPGIKDEQDRKDLIAYMKTAK